LAQDYKLIKNFISRAECASIVSWVDQLSPEASSPNHHLRALSESVNGKSMVFDLSCTSISSYIANFQKIHGVRQGGVPDFVMSIIDRAAELVDLPKDHLFLQVVDMQKGGKIDAHYDAAVEGYINYKCNISVRSEDYDFKIDRTSIKISERDMYCFEASLYRHWTDRFNSRRVLLSIGLVVPYTATGRDSADPRVRLSRRIEKYFQ
jgi:hypothetical protein